MNRFSSTSLLAVLATLSLALSSQAQITPGRIAPINPGALRLPPDFKIAELPPALSPALVRAHVLKPINVQNISSFDFNEARKVVLLDPNLFKTTPHFDAKSFTKAVDSALKGQVNGYMLEVRRGSALTTKSWQWATSPTLISTQKEWNDDTRMHIASVSKLVTMMGMIKALDLYHVSEDAKIVDFLPSYWTKGKNIDKITFRNLLQQTSGFATNGSDSDYGFMKGMVAKGVSGVGAYDYENMNFGICRILIPILNGDIKKSAKFTDDAALNDSSWDSVTLYHFKNFMQKWVFHFSGVEDASFNHIPGEQTALAYKFPLMLDTGWDSGDLQTMAGGAGWRLSTKELLSVMATFRGGGIVPVTRAQYCLDNGYGLDQIMDTPAGRIYNKNGLWRNNGHVEQCIAYYMPNDTEVTLFVNSQVSKDGTFLRDIINTAIKDSIKE